MPKKKNLRVFHSIHDSLTLMKRSLTILWVSLTHIGWHPTSNSKSLKPCFNLMFYMLTHPVKIASPYKPLLLPDQTSTVLHGLLLGQHNLPTQMVAIRILFSINIALVIKKVVKRNSPNNNKHYNEHRLGGDLRRSATSIQAQWKDFEE